MNKEGIYHTRHQNTSSLLSQVLPANHILLRPAPGGGQTLGRKNILLWWHHSPSCPCVPSHSADTMCCWVLLPPVQRKTPMTKQKRKCSAPGTTAGGKKHKTEWMAAMWFPLNVQNYKCKYFKIYIQIVWDMKLLQNTPPSLAGFCFVTTGVLRNKDIITCFSGWHLCLKHPLHCDLGTLEQAQPFRRPMCWGTWQSSCHHSLTGGCVPNVFHYRSTEMGVWSSQPGGFAPQEWYWAQAGWEKNPQLLSRRLHSQTQETRNMRSCSWCHLQQTGFGLGERSGLCSTQTTQRLINKDIEICMAKASKRPYLYNRTKPRS